ncbi:MAG: carbohydrate deacetylase [Planctomycetota bacterium]|jgi:hopanoid biosynthesis associated protein HpnK
MDARIIVNADDFGLSEGVNRAVIQAYQEGVLTSATLMAGAPAARQAVEMSKAEPGLGVGIHLNLTEGKAVSQDLIVKCLVDSKGNFRYSAGKLAMLSMIRPKIRQAIRTELAAQIQYVIDSGLKPTHMDSHKHIHTFPVLYSIVCQLAAQFGIRALRLAYEPGDVSDVPWPLPSAGGAERARITRGLAAINKMQNSDYFRTKGLLGVAHTGKIDVSFFKALTLYNKLSIAEVMTHPGYADGLDANSTRLLKQRELELDALCDERTKTLFQEAGIKLVHYGQL